MIKLAIFNCKGGVGKTTLAIILTQIALFNKQKVLAIDLDEQSNFYTSISYLRDEPGFKDLLTLKTVLTKEDLNDTADWLIIDCPPTFNDRSRTAIKKADIILIPVRPDIYSIQHFSTIRKVAGDYKEMYQFPLVKIGFMEGNVHDKTLAAKDIQKKIADKKFRVLGDLPLYATITSNISSERYKLWRVGLSKAACEPFESLYKRLMFIHKLVEGAKQKKKTNQYYDYYEDKDNPDITMFGINSRKK